MMLFIDHIITAQLARAICWTLIHSLWLGAAAALLAALLLILFGRHRAAIRYNLLTGILGLFIAAVVFTFFLEINSEAAIESAMIHAAEETPSKTNPVSPFQAVVGWCNRHADWIVMIWFILFCFQCLYTTRDLFTIHRIKTNGTSEIAREWEELLADLRSRIGLTKKVTIKTSRLVQQPVLIGVLKPLILIPASLCMQLTKEQAEAVLLHELAHIKRNDFLVNLLQRVTETIFFFNPALWWLSDRIREEREYCCDDVVIQVMGNKTGIVRAIIACTESSMPHYALGFAGQKRGILHRIQRIVQGEPFSFNGIERLSLLVFFIIGVAVLAFTIPTFKPSTNKRALPHQIATDSIPAGASKEFIEGYKAGLNYKNRTLTTTDRKHLEAEMKKKREIEEKLRKQQRATRF